MKFSSHILQIVLALILCMGFISPSLAQESEKLYQQGLVKEEGEGSLQEAIKIYTQVVDDASADRSLRAKALLHVGICYEKLGQEKAKASYEQLISEYADQGDVVAIGKKKLSKLESSEAPESNSGIVVKEIFSGEYVYAISPDGRYLTYIDWVAIELKVHDVKTGKNWFLTDRGTWKAPIQFPDNSIWSPDGKKIAYYWYSGDTTEIHMINPDGSDDRILCKDIEVPWPVSWSDDGKYLLAIKVLKRESMPFSLTNEIALISTRDGSIQMLKTKEEHIVMHLSMSPDGRYIAADVRRDPKSENTDVLLLALDGSQESFVVSSPAKDWDVMWTKDGKSLLFLSDRMGSTDLWSLNVNEGVPKAEPILLKSNMGERAHLLGFIKEGSLSYMVSNERSDVYQAELDFTSGEVLSKPERVSKGDEVRNIKAIWSPDGRYIAYMTDHHEFDYRYGRRFVFIIYDTKTGSDRKVWTDLYGMPSYFWFHPRWSKDGKRMLVNASTQDYMRGLYEVDLSSGKEKAIFVKKVEPGEHAAIGYFQVYSPDGTEIYYLSMDRKSILKLHIESKEEKVVFSSEEQMILFSLAPDGKQIVFKYWFTEKSSLYVVATEGGSKRKIAEFESNLRPYIISWSPDLQYVIVDLRDIPEQKDNTLYRIPVDGGEPQRLIKNSDLFSQGHINKAEIHPDGRKALLEIGVGFGVEVWALENLFSQ